MRFTTLLFLVFSLLNCKSKKEAITIPSTTKSQLFQLENCALDTQCSLEIILNSSLSLNQDKEQNSYFTIEKGDKTIIKYLFKRNEPPNTADANYSESIYFEIDKSDKQLFLANNALQDVKMMYQRLCYCKDGTSGTFKVTQGQLKLIKTDDILSLDLTFKVGKIPQLLTEIKETITLP